MHTWQATCMQHGEVCIPGRRLVCSMALFLRSPSCFVGSLILLALSVSQYLVSLFPALGDGNKLYGCYIWITGTLYSFKKLIIFLRSMTGTTIRDFPGLFDFQNFNCIFKIAFFTAVKWLKILQNFFPRNRSVPRTIGFI